MPDLDPLNWVRLAGACVALLCLADAFKSGGERPLRLGFALSSASLLFFTLGNLAAGGPAFVSAAFAILGGAGCGWFWVYSRTLFRPTNENIPNWAFALVAAIIAVEAAREAAAPNHVLRVLENFEMMLSSTLMALGLAEALRGLHSFGAQERRFRVAFVSAYGAMISASVLWLRHSADGSTAAAAGDAVKAGCVFFALAVGFFAFRYRLANPVRAEAPARRERRRNAGPASPEEAALAARIASKLADDEAFKIPTIKVADLAHMLGEPDYKVSRCVTGAMGFANFNRLVNHHRIAHAKALLSDPASDGLSILAIGLECGFGSIGPFNRSFKDVVGQTPREYRAGRRKDVRDATEALGAAPA